jgi:hypothetical protein
MTTNGAVQTMEAPMPLWTISEPMQLTRDELCDLAATIEHALPDLEAGSVERLDALISLDNIRRVLTLRGLSP